MAKKQAAPFIPQTPDELTAEWLTSALRRGGVLRDARVESFETGRPGSGTGFAGITTKVDLTYDRDAPDAPTSLVAKFPTNVEHRGVMEAEGNYEREIWFYEGFGRDLPVRVPAAYYTEMDPGQSVKTRQRAARAMNRVPIRLARVVGRNAHKLVRPTKRRYVVLIEYIEDARLTPLDQVPTDDDLRVILDQLAVLHAGLWGDPRLTTDLAVSYDTASQQHRLLAGGYEVFRDATFEQHPDIKPYQRRAMDWAQANLERILASFNDPLTLLHGDPRTDNMLFTPDGGVVMIDFGTVSSGPPGWDVAYLLSATLEPGDAARDRLDEFARHYHDALLDQGVDGYSFERLRNDIDLSLCFQGHRQVLSSNIIEGTYDSTDSGDEQGIGELWFRKVLDLLPTELPRLP